MAIKQVLLTRRLAANNAVSSVLFSDKGGAKMSLCLIIFDSFTRLGAIMATDARKVLVLDTTDVLNCF